MMLWSDEELLAYVAELGTATVGALASGLRLKDRAQVVRAALKACKLGPADLYPILSRPPSSIRNSLAGTQTWPILEVRQIAVLLGIDARALSLRIQGWDHCIVSSWSQREPAGRAANWMDGTFFCATECQAANGAGCGDLCHEGRYGPQCAGCPCAAPAPAERIGQFTDWTQQEADRRARARQQRERASNAWEPKWAEGVWILG